MDNKQIPVKKAGKKGFGIVISEETGECFVCFDNFAVAVFPDLEAFKNFVIEKSKETGNDFETWKASRG